MKNPAQPAKAQAGFFENISTPNYTGKPPVFKGTDNPREQRLIDLLLRRPSASREAVDSEVGCSNAPDLISRVRDQGLGEEHLRCIRIRVIDRDGKVSRPGVYFLSGPGRRAVLRWLANRKNGGAQ